MSQFLNFSISKLLTPLCFKSNTYVLEDYCQLCAYVLGLIKTENAYVLEKNINYSCEYHFFVLILWRSNKYVLLCMIVI